MKQKWKSYSRKLNEVIRKRQAGRLAYFALQLLAKTGLRISPYYFTREYMPDNLKLEMPAGLELTFNEFFTPFELEQIYNHPETKWMVSAKTLYPDEACRCFVLKQGQEVAAYTWANLNRCCSPYSSFPLKDNEAYLFNAYTYDKYRGMNLAPYLRYRVYEALYKMGRTRFFSETEYFNTAAVNFKKKLGAKHVKLSLYIGLFSRFKWNIKLREYRV